jgi:hypothetical protein
MVRLGMMEVDMRALFTAEKLLGWPSCHRSCTACPTLMQNNLALPQPRPFYAYAESLGPSPRTVPLSNGCTYLAGNGCQTLLKVN